MQSVAARWGFVAGRWRRDVEVFFSRGVILRVAVAKGAPRRILIPGLVNAHTHLELTALGGEVKRGSFTAWAQELGAARARLTPAEVEASVCEGLRLSALAGTTSIGDFAYLSGVDAVRQSGFRMVSWREALGIDPAMAASAAKRALKFSTAPRGMWTPGLAPHAPYSCSPELFRALHREARRRRIPFATHLSELREEIRFLKDGGGPFRDMLRAIGRDSGAWRPPGLRPVEYLARLGVLRGATVAHANYLDAADVRLLARAGASIVWCPRTHAFFGHRAHPVKRLLAAGVNVALGTDSLASAPTLSVLDEVRAAAAKVGLDAALRMATEGGARALRLRRVGRIARGWAADFSLVEGAEPGDLLRPARLAGRWVAGIET